MCTNPQINSEGQTYACYYCKDCLDARRNDWVARAMCEKATNPHVLALMLSYRNNPDGSKPRSAIAFNYKDVQDFLKRLREAYYTEYKKRGEIRFIVAGETGSERKRVHWHMIVFAKRPLEVLGKWFDLEGYPIDGVQYDENVHWSLWRDGFVHPQKPDQGGVQYVLKYALKGQFNSHTGRGRMGQTKLENATASKFVMSKAPPIGFEYMQAVSNEWEERLICPPTLKLNVPDLQGYYWPRGAYREYLLERIYEINEKRIALHGKPCTGYAALLKTFEQGSKDWEILIYGPQKEIEPEEISPWEFERSSFPYTERQKIRNNCGRLLPCKGCREIASQSDVAEFVALVDFARKEDGFHDWTNEAYFARKNTENPFCCGSGTPENQDAFDWRHSKKFEWVQIPSDKNEG